VLRVKLQHLEAWNARRQRVAQRYLEGLAGSALVLPTVRSGAEPVWHLFVIRSQERDALAARLASEGIQTLIHYPIPPHRQTAYASLGHAAGAFPLAERLADEVLSLPMGPHIEEAQVARVLEVLAS
jgi:dTDP-4-amino-4,6-dideoxygalactose transaminase